MDALFVILAALAVLVAVDVRSIDWDDDRLGRSGTGLG